MVRLSKTSPKTNNGPNSGLLVPYSVTLCNSPARLGWLNLKLWVK